MGEIIKATAKYQEADEPTKRKPIIQIDAAQTPGATRASVDSGRDNPFRPDGEIYKSADPIVDFYKYGPNQSRAQSPTDSQLLIGEDGAKMRKKLAKSDKRRQRPEQTLRGACWRRWLCCCCGCFRCCPGKRTREEADSSISPNGNLTTTIGSLQEQSLEIKLANSKQNSSNEQLDSRKAKESKQTKIVVLNTPEASAAAAKTDQDPQGDTPRVGPKEAARELDEASGAGAQTSTQAKTKSSRCNVS